MAFVLRGEIDIDGRKGIVTLRQTQREAEKTSKSFERGSRVNAQFVKSLFSINSQAAATNRALLLLGRTGGVGLFGAGLVKGGIALGDTLTRIGQEAETSGKSLDKAFQAGLTATSAEAVKSSIESISAEIERLKAKTEGFSVARAIGTAIEKITGVDIGLKPEEGLIAAGEKQIEILKKQFEARKKFQETIKIQDAYNKGLDIEQAKFKELIKLDFARSGPIARTRRRLGSEQFQIGRLELDQQKIVLDNLKKQRDELLSISGIRKDDEVVQKLALEIRKQELVVLRAQASFEKVARQEKGGILTGTRAGRAALGKAEQRKQRQDEQDARQRELDYLKKRLEDENKKRQAQGLPPLTLEDMRRRVAEEAVGLRPSPEEEAAKTGKLPSATTESGGGGLKAEITPTETAMKELLTEFKNLASTLKTAPLVTSGAGA
jgi:hypothetical protein